MSWFRRDKTENRNYTDQRITDAAAKVNGDEIDANTTAAVQAAAGLWGRCFAAAVVNPEALAAQVTPSVLYEIGRSFVLHGESCWLIDGDGRDLRLVQATDWDVTGTVSWSYRLTLAGPTGTYVRRVGDDSVLHPRINVDPAHPHRGCSSVSLAGLTGGTLAGLERQFKREAKANSGYVIPSAVEGLSDTAFTELKNDIAALKGRSTLVPSLAPRSGDPGAGPGRADWQARRLGANPPEHAVSLHSDVAVAVLGAAGVPPALFAASTDGSGSREAYRQLLHSSVMPAGVLLAGFLQDAFEVAVDLKWDRLAAADVQGRARAYRSLVGTEGGLEDSEARRVTGMA